MKKKVILNEILSVLERIEARLEDIHDEIIQNGMEKMERNEYDDELEDAEDLASLLDVVAEELDNMTQPYTQEYVEEPVPTNLDIGKPLDFDGK